MGRGTCPAHDARRQAGRQQERPRPSVWARQAGLVGRPAGRRRSGMRPRESRRDSRTLRRRGVCWWWWSWGWGWGWGLGSRARGSRGRSALCPLLRSSWIPSSVLLATDHSAGSVSAEQGQGRLAGWLLAAPEPGPVRCCACAGSTGPDCLRIHGGYRLW
jgi:hypothetical protein